MTRRTSSSSSSLISRRSLVAAGVAAAAASAGVGPLALAQARAPLAGKFASSLYMQFPAGEAVPTAVQAQGYRFPVEWYDTAGQSYTADDLR